MTSRITQVPVEVLVTPSDTKAQATQVFGEALLSPDEALRLTGQTAEPLQDGDPEIRLTSQCVEVLVRQGLNGIKLNAGNEASVAIDTGLGNSGIALSAGNGASVLIETTGAGPAPAVCPVPQKETVIWQYGGQADRLVLTLDGQGIETAWQTICPSVFSPYYSGYMVFWLISGTVRVTLLASDGVTTWKFPDGTDGKAFSNQRNVWVELGVAGIELFTLGATMVKIRLEADSGPAEVVVNAAQITQSAGQEPFIEGAGPTRLWQAANGWLKLNGTPTKRFRVNVLDLTSYDPTRWPNDDVVLGGQVLIKEPTLGVAEVQRIVEVEKDLLTAADLSVTLAKRPIGLTEQIARPRKPPRQPTTVDTFNEPHVEASFRYPVVDPGVAYVTLVGRPAGAAVKYVLQVRGDPILPAGDASYLPYSAEFTVTQANDYDVQLSAYAILGNKVSKVQTWFIPASKPPGGTLILTEAPTGSGPQLTVSLTPTTSTAKWRLYRGINLSGGGWPTVDHDVAGVLDETLFVQEVTITADSGGLDPTGVTQAGGLLYIDPTLYPAGTVIKIIVVPIDVNGQAGTRLTAELTVQGDGAVSPRLDAKSVVRQSWGACPSTPAVDRLFWTPSSSVTAGMVLEIYANTLLIQQFSDPVAVQQWDYTDALPGTAPLAGQAARGVLYEYKLKQGATLLDSGQFGVVRLLPC